MNTTHRNACDSLGCCQAREPACPGCTHDERDHDQPLITPEDTYSFGALLADIAMVIFMVLVLGYLSGFLWARNGAQIVAYILGA